jgi:hypothetical protein
MAREGSNDKRAGYAVTASGFYRRYEAQRRSDRGGGYEPAQHGDREVPEFQVPAAGGKFPGAGNGLQPALVVV